MRVNGGRFQISLSRKNQNTISDKIVFDLEDIKPGWNDFVGKYVWSPLNEYGKLTIWKDRKLARLYNPVSRKVWKIPTHQVPGIQAQYTAFPTKGAAKSIFDRGEESSVREWRGLTLDKAVGRDPIDHSFRTGVYSSDWNPQLDKTPGLTLAGVYDPNSHNFIPENLRKRHVWYDVVKWQPLGTGMKEMTDSEIFRSMDPEGRGPLELPSWWQEDPDDPEEIDFSLSIRIPSQVYRTILAAVRPFKPPS